MGRTEEWNRLRVEHLRPANGGHRPWVGGPFRWRLNLRPLDPAQWLEFGADSDTLLARKAELLETHRDTVFGSLPGVEDAGNEILEQIVDHLRAHHPERLHPPDPNEHPLIAAARLVPEDLVMMTTHEHELVFSAGVVCFPNRWDLASKVGQPLRSVHAPVAQLNDQLAAPIDAFFGRLSAAKSFWRLGWGLIETDELYQPLDGTAGPRAALPDAARAGEQVWVRVERETLRRFSRTGVVLFTIRTHLTRVADLVDQPDELARLADAIGALPPDVADYKGTAPLTGPLLRWLRDHVPERPNTD